MSFSALQRAEIAEMDGGRSVPDGWGRFSALQRAEIAEMGRGPGVAGLARVFQCSSTSRNC